MLPYPTPPLTLQSLPTLHHLSPYKATLPYTSLSCNATLPCTNSHIAMLPFHTPALIFQSYLTLHHFSPCNTSIPYNSYHLVLLLYPTPAIILQCCPTLNQLSSCNATLPYTSSLLAMLLSPKPACLAMLPSPTPALILQCCLTLHQLSPCNEPFPTPALTLQRMNSYNTGFARTNCIHLAHCELSYCHISDWNCLPTSSILEFVDFCCYLLFIVNNWIALPRCVLVANHQQTFLQWPPRRGRLLRRLVQRKSFGQYRKPVTSPAIITLTDLLADATSMGRSIGVQM